MTYKHYVISGVCQVFAELIERAFRKNRSLVGFVA